MVSRVLSRLDDMLAASAITVKLVAGNVRTRPTIEMLALERALSIVSEASRHIPDAMKADYPDVPWRKIAGLGNILRHEDQHLDPVILIGIAADDLPALRPVLEEMLRTLESQG